MIQHYQQDLEVRDDEYLGEKVATMVREYRSEEGIRNLNNNSLQRYRVNIHWSKNLGEQDLHGSLTLIEFQEAVPDLDSVLFFKIDDEIHRIEFRQLESTLQIAGTDDEVEIKKFHAGKFDVPREILDKIRRSNTLSLRLYAGLSTYTFDVPGHELDLLKNMIRQAS